MRVTHVFPVADSGVHTVDLHCWCAPEIRGGEGVVIVVHREVNEDILELDAKLLEEFGALGHS